MKSKNVASPLAAEFQNIIQDFESLLKEADSLGGKEFKDVKEKLMTRLTSAKEEISQKSEDFTDKVHETGTDISEKISDEPWKAIGTAALAGLLIGYLFARR